MKRLLRKSVTLGTTVRQRHEYRPGQNAYSLASERLGEIVAMIAEGAFLTYHKWQYQPKRIAEFVPWAVLRPSSDPKWL